MPTAVWMSGLRGALLAGLLAPEVGTCGGYGYWMYGDGWYTANPAWTGYEMFADNEGPYGLPGLIHFCAPNQYVVAVALMVFPDAGQVDDLAAIALAALCLEPYDPTVYTGGVVLPYYATLPAAWSSYAVCPPNMAVKTFWTKVEAPLGEAIGQDDDTTLNSVAIQCQNPVTGELSGLIEPQYSNNVGYWGTWSSAATCPGDQIVCGVRTLVEPGDAHTHDETALNGIRLSCCLYWPNPAAMEVGDAATDDDEWTVAATAGVAAGAAGGVLIVVAAALVWRRRRGKRATAGTAAAGAVSMPQASLASLPRERADSVSLSEEPAGGVMVDAASIPKPDAEAAAAAATEAEAQE